MFTKVIGSLSMFIFLTIAHPGANAMQKPAVSDNYYVLHQVTAADSQTCTLDDGSTWQLSYQSSIQTGTYVWILPFMQESLYAVLFNNLLDPTTTLMQSGSTTLFITNYNASTNTVTLSDTTQWVLDPYYQKYTSGWKANDPITLAGRHNEYFLINGNNYLTSTYSLVTPAATAKPAKK